MYKPHNPEPRECGSCQRPSENRAWDCPPRMADGRLFTDYRPRCLQNLQYRKDAMEGSYDYRQYMIQNGTSLINTERKKAAALAECGPCVEPVLQGTMVPEADKWVCNKQTCARVSTGAGPFAFATGRDYGLDKSLLKYQQETQKAVINRQKRLAKGPANCCGCDPDAGGGKSIRVKGIPTRYAYPGAGMPHTASSTDPLVKCT